MITKGLLLLAGILITKDEFSDGLNQYLFDGWKRKGEEINKEMEGIDSKNICYKHSS